MTQRSGIRRQRPFDRPAFKRAVHQMLTAAGFEIDPAHLANTSERVTELWSERLLGGHDRSPSDILGKGFEDPQEDLVVVRDIAIFGMCPHHLVPWHGVAHVAYLPGGKLFGFGQLARLVDALSHRLTYQEWVSRNVVNALTECGQARGAACVVSALQLCIALGGDRRGGERVVTTAFAGEFENDSALRAEFLRSVDMS